MLTLFKNFTRTSMVALITTMTFASTTTLSSQAHADRETGALIAGSLIGLGVGLAIDRPTTEVHRTTIIERSPPRYGHSFYSERQPYYEERYYDDRYRHRRYEHARDAYYDNHRGNQHRYYSTQPRNTDYYYQPEVRETQITIRETLPAQRPDTGKRIIIR